VVATIMMTRPAPCAGGGKRGLLEDTIAGLRYVWQTPELLALIGLMVITSLLARPYNQLLPVFASDVLQIGAAGLAALNAAAGIGAIVAGVLVAALGTFPRRGLFAVLSGVLFGSVLIVFALSRSLAVSLAMAALLGFCSTYSSISANTLLQAYSSSRMRGRVMGLHGLTMMGIVPLGAMLEGALGGTAGVPIVLFYGGVLTVVATLVITVRGARVHTLA
jgi:MFS family permease